jgi:hypothetical protein
MFGMASECGSPPILTAVKIALNTSKNDRTRFCDVKRGYDNDAVPPFELS